ncbi:MAG: caspase family protein, partial [Betaproteobacteria bacterium]
TANRMALVIGNSSYRDSPLKNPANDAKALAKSLSACGFSPQLLLDASQKDMASAITSYGARLASKKAVGIFYYAGHGVQLAWRNYLIPVDAVIDRLEDLPKRCVELNTLLGALTKAENPMNIIILDACRDNPFGSRLPPEQKGLSQFDAPPGSLLSYATAPGNTASDGTGANGLFTENLLREMMVDGAKLEDVFKRVRLNVRLQSRGQQIPWESTSLEDDFYFLPPKQSNQVSVDEKNRRFEEEQLYWDKARVATTPEPVHAYLRKYPSGMYSELAQAWLDKILSEQGEKKTIAANSSANPYTKGSAQGIGRFSVGDSFKFVKKELFSGLVVNEFTETVTEVLNDRTVFDDERRVIDLLGNDLKSPNARFLSRAQFYPAEYSVGQKWTTRFDWRRGDGQAGTLEVEFKIVGRVPLGTAAGRFNAFEVEGRGYVNGGSTFDYHYLIDPEKCSRPLIFDVKVKHRRGGWGETTRIELVEFKQASKEAGRS